MIGKGEAAHVGSFFGNDNLSRFATCSGDCIQQGDRFFKRATLHLNLFVEAFNRFVQTINLSQQFGQNKTVMGLPASDRAIPAARGAIQSQIDALRDSAKIVHLYGTLLSNVPDYNGLQILVDRIDVRGVTDRNS